MNSEIETDTLNRIEELLVQLSEAREAFKSWADAQPVNADFLDRERQEWVRSKPWDTAYCPEKLNEWNLREPGFLSLARVKAARIKIANLQRDLDSAKLELQELVQIGTPLSHYVNTVNACEVAVNGLVQRVAKERMDNLVFQQFGTADWSRLPRSVTDAVRLDKSLVHLYNHKFRSRIGLVRDENIAIRDVHAAGDAVAEALEKVKDLIARHNPNDLSSIASK